MAVKARKKKKKLNENSSRCKNFNSPCLSPSNFYREKKIQQMVPISKHEYTQFTQKPFSVNSKTNKWYQSQKPAKFTQSVNSKYTQSEN